MNKHRELEYIEQLKQIEQLEHIEIVVWAFEHGYQLAKQDIKEGIHIERTELRKQFLHDLNELVKQQKS